MNRCHQIIISVILLAAYTSLLLNPILLHTHHYLNSTLLKNDSYLPVFNSTFPRALSLCADTLRHHGYEYLALQSSTQVSTRPHHSYIMELSFFSFRILTLQL